MKVPKGDYKDELVDGAVLKKAIESALGMIGVSGLRILFYDFEARGILLEPDRICSLKEVCGALNEIFGGRISCNDDGTDIPATSLNASSLERFMSNAALTIQPKVNTPDRLPNST